MLLSTLLQAVLVINEIMASNVGTAMSPATNFDSWIEIYNPGTEAVDLGGMYLSDDPDNPTRWRMPGDVGIVPAKGFKVVWLGSHEIKTNQGPFKLDCDGGAIYLSDQSGQLITSEEYPEAISRTSWARKTDGTGEWGWTADVTPGRSNARAVFNDQRLQPPVVSKDSRIFNSAFSFQVNIPEGATLAYTTDGSLPQRPRNGQGSQWTNYVVNGDCEGDDDISLVGKDGDEGGAFITKFVEGEGFNGSRGVKVHAVANPQQDWDTQFFVFTPNRVWKTNDKYRFKMKVRADRACHISVQSHTTPGNYIHYQMLDYNGYDITTEWQEIVFVGTITSDQTSGNTKDMQTIAFNLNELREVDNNFYFDDISWEEDILDTPWVDYVINGDCESDDVTSLVGRDGDNGGTFITKIVDGAGYNNSRAVKVHAVANPSQDWDTQFFVYTPNHTWNTSEKFRFKMKVRADRACHISVQSHTTPGNYIHWQMLDGGYDITTSWKEIVYEGTITSDQTSGGNKALQTIAFNLNELRGVENNFYFDDISWEAYEDETTSSTKVSTDGQFTVSNTTNYRFRLFQDGYLPSVPVTRSFIKTSNQYTIPVVSIVGDKRYFTDNQWGIDTEGTNGKTGNGQTQPRNYNMDWDRPVNFSFIDTEGEMTINQDVDICVSGGWTRSATPRSFKLKAGKEYDGQNTLDYMFFPQKPYLRNKTILLRNGGNDIWFHDGSRFMDPALQTIVQRAAINLDLQSYVPVIEYVNGEFRGVLNMREPNNKKFVEANWGYDDERIDMFEMSPDSNVCFKVGNADVLEHIYELGAASPDPAAYQELMQILDIDEYVNYMAVELFLGSDDWPHNNIKGFRSQDDGRYRFVTFDLDFAFNNDSPFTAFANEQRYSFNYIDGARVEEIKLVTLFLNLLKNNEFRKKFIDTYCLIGGSVFETERATAIVDELADRVRPMMQYDGFHTPDGSANVIKEQLKTRNGQMTSRMKEFSPMKLSNVNKQQVKLSSDTEGANLYVNGIEVPYTYFNGYLFAPVQLEAKAPAGYTFAGWKKGNATTYFSTEEVIDLPTDNTMQLKACFTPMTEAERLEQGFTPVRINEVSASNNIFVNEYWKRNDWVELYNTTNQPVDVEGMYLTDNLSKPHKYQIQKGESSASTIIPPRGHLIIWCDKLLPISQLHASFKLGAEGGDVMLSAADDSWSDVLSYPTHKADETVGRYPDGSNTVQVMNIPTIEKTNITSSYAVTYNNIKYLLGDVNHDGEVTVLDVTMTVSHILGETMDNFHIENADVNGDGTVNISDVTAIVNIVLKI
ncbi:MAG: lamin tail domain-containing protein [Prevotella sp.]|nr:lamin tail domain-containing protein [Prevotella sp.]